MSEIVKLGYLYSNNVKINYPSKTSNVQSYVSGQLIELRNTSESTTGQLEWMPFSFNGINYLLSTNNLLKNISYSDLLSQDFITGNSKTITLNNIKYRVRIPTEAEWNLFVLNQGNFTQVPIPNQNDLNGTYDTTSILLSDTNNLWNWYGMSTLCNNVSGSNVTTKGNTKIGNTGSIAKTAKNDTTGWRILLEQWNNIPTISDEDKSIGYYTKSFTRDFYIYDEDKELMKVDVYIDDVLLSTFNDRLNGTTLTVDLESVFNTLSFSKHTIKIKVTDSYGHSVYRYWTFTKMESANGSSINLAKPNIVTPNNSGILTSINAKVNNTIEFTTNGGALIYKHEIYITNSNSPLTTVYNTINTTYDLKSVIAGGILTNGEEYQIKIRTYDAEGNYSAWSESVIVKTYAPVELSINIVDNRVTTSNPIFKGTFSQENGDTLLRYQFILYKNGIAVEEGEIKTDGLLTQQFNNLENKTDYVLQLIVKTENGVESSLSQSFYCVYVQTRLSSIMTVENVKSKGMINVETFIKQIIGYVSSGNSNITYIDGEWANLHNSNVRYDSTSPFRIESDFTIKIFGRDFEEDVMIQRIYQELGYIELTRHKNNFLLSKYVNGNLLYQKYVYIKGDISTTDVFYIFIQCEISTGLMSFDVKRIGDRISSWFIPTHTEDVAPSYSKEDGLLTYFNQDLVKLITPVTIDGIENKLYIPSKDEIYGEGAFRYFNTSAVSGKAITGRAKLGKTSHTSNTDILENIKYYTRTVSSVYKNQLITVDENGEFIESYPNESKGIKLILNLPNTLQVSKTIDADGFHQLILMKNKFIYFDTINISNLQLGDKIKDYGTKYNNKAIEFTVIDKNKLNNNITLMTNVIATKEYDFAENTYINGNTSWKLSNICQWVNNNNKLADD